MSLSYLEKLKAKETSNGQPISINRFEQDQAAFRGRLPPIKNEEEYEQLTAKVFDVDAKLFDLSVPEELFAYKEVLQGAVNNVYQVISRLEEMVRQPDGGVKVYAYCVWKQGWIEPK